MARFFLPRHGRTHCPGGSDPIPCLVTTPWVAVFDDVIFGQSVDDGTEPDDVRIKFVDSQISSNGAEFFAITSEADTELGQDIVTPSILQDGLYQFTMRVRWTNADYPHFVIRYYFEDGTDFTYPGELGFPFAGWFADYIHHMDEDFASWEAVHVISAILPVQITGGDVWDMWPRMLVREKAGGTGGLDGVVNFKNMYVARLGDF